MKILITMVTMLTTLVLAPATPAGATTDEPVAVTAPDGANRACPPGTVKIFTATVRTRQKITQVGTFTLVLANDATRTSTGQIVPGTKHLQAEYVVIVKRGTKVKMGARHTFRLRYNGVRATFRLTKDCVERME